MAIQIYVLILLLIMYNMCGGLSLNKLLKTKTKSSDKTQKFEIFYKVAHILRTFNQLTCAYIYR